MLFRRDSTFDANPGISSMFRISRLGILLAIGLLSGCRHDNPHATGGRLIAEHKPEKEAELAKAPYSATYVLYQQPAAPTDPPPRRWVPDEQAVELFVRGLGKRQPIGFEKTSGGKLVAVAGEEKISLEPGRYRWTWNSNDRRVVSCLENEPQMNTDKHG